MAIIQKVVGSCRPPEGWVCWCFLKFELRVFSLWLEQVSNTEKKDARVIIPPQYFYKRLSLSDSQDIDQRFCKNSVRLMEFGGRIGTKSRKCQCLGLSEFGATVTISADNHVVWWSQLNFWSAALFSALADKYVFLACVWSRHFASPRPRLIIHLLSPILEMRDIKTSK